MKPRMTKKVLEGLSRLAGLADAGGAAELTGYDEDQIAKFVAKGDTSSRDALRAIDAACRWIRAIQRHRGE